MAHKDSSTDDRIMYVNAIVTLNFAAVDKLCD